VTLNANLTSTGGFVNEGTVKFTVKTPTQIQVTANVNPAGAASTTIQLPANLPAGQYDITADYVDSTNAIGGTNFATSSASSVLSVASATTQLSATNVTTEYHIGTNTVTVTANVTSPAGTVTSGNVTFSVAGVTPVTASVVAGVATTTLTLPAQFALGNYNINAAYADATNSNNTVNFVGSSGTGTLTVGQAKTSVTVTPNPIVYNPNTQTMTVQVAVVGTDTGEQVNEGSVQLTFLGSISNAVALDSNNKGMVSITLSVPAALAATTSAGYSVTATYTDPVIKGSGGNFQDGTHTGYLLVNSAPSTSVNIVSTATHAAGSLQHVRVTSQVTNPVGAVNEGYVTFTVNGTVFTAPVHNGIAVGKGTVGRAGSSPVTAQYTDGVNANSAYNFAQSPVARTTMVLQAINALFGATITYNASGGMTSVTNVFGLTLVINYDGSGKITSATLNGLPIAI
jgi:YD repeat-containing protein